MRNAGSHVASGIFERTTLPPVPPVPPVSLGEVWGTEKHDD